MVKHSFPVGHGLALRRYRLTVSDQEDVKIRLQMNIQIENIFYWKNKKCN